MGYEGADCTYVRRSVLITKASSTSHKWSESLVETLRIHHIRGNERIGILSVLRRQCDGWTKKLGIAEKEVNTPTTYSDYGNQFVCNGFRMKKRVPAI